MEQKKRKRKNKRRFYFREGYLKSKIKILEVRTSQEKKTDIRERLLKKKNFIETLRNVVKTWWIWRKKYFPHIRGVESENPYLHFFFFFQIHDFFCIRVKMKV
jgi:hypothetical protein